MYQQNTFFSVFILYILRKVSQNDYATSNPNFIKDKEAPFTFGRDLVRCLAGFQCTCAGFQ